MLNCGAADTLNKVHTFCNWRYFELCIYDLLSLLHDLYHYLSQKRTLFIDDIIGDQSSQYNW